MEASYSYTEAWGLQLSDSDSAQPNRLGSVHPVSRGLQLEARAADTSALGGSLATAGDQVIRVMGVGTETAIGWLAWGKLCHVILTHDCSCICRLKQLFQEWTFMSTSR